MKKLLLIAGCFIQSICFANTLYINEIPDFTQTNIIGGHSGNGQQYCAPVSVSNSLVWLKGAKDKQEALIHKLASKAYMNTSLKNGTGTSGVLKGVAKISNELFGGYKKLEYEGWRKHPKKYSLGIKQPNIDKIQSFITNKSAAWINVGWYKYNGKRNEYMRIGGHWVSLVGSTSEQLILHDPAPRAGSTFSNEYVSYSKISNGLLTGKKHGLPVSAKGFIKLNNGMHKKQSADAAIIDGVIYFSI
ncbi:hypothetical protein [Flocculibacter collagenilyticus]|uniref:hypothetical protein n=1 Tax=Flocculibacter collagenilyticus TaxID=2744479 RepID=UPI0018F4FA49|nr:hypothetical protein [Flocculibacter collagenilyticus]